MAAEFARSGANVALLARTAATLEETVAAISAESTGVRVMGVTCDVGDGAALAEAHRKVVAAFGTVDIVVNNAGTSAARAFEASSDEDWQHDLDLKLLAAIRLVRLCLPAMKAQRWGRIINVLNIGAKAPGARSAPTSVSRAAGMAMTKAVAAEYAPFGILCNAINTGILLTNQWHRLHQEQMPDRSFDEYIATRARAVPLGRMGDPAEFANLACFLASDKASYITGTAINVDGGMSPVV